MVFTNFTKCAKSLGALIAWGLLSSNLLFGQASATTTGTVTGHVRGPGGVSVPGATVQITNPRTGERKETWTDESGNYTFTGLIPGNYRLDVSLVGFRADSREPVPVATGGTLKVNVALVVALPEDNAPQPVQAAARPPGNRPSLPAGGGNRGGTFDDLQNSMGAGAGPGGPGTSLRIAEGNGGEGPASAGAQPEEADTSTSANNSFLLGGGMGEAATPGGGFGGGRGGRGGGGGAIAFYKTTDGGYNWFLATDDPRVAETGSQRHPPDSRPQGRIGGGDLPPITVDPKSENVVYSCSTVFWRTEGLKECRA